MSNIGFERSTCPQSTSESLETSRLHGAGVIASVVLASTIAVAAGSATRPEIVEATWGHVQEATALVMNFDIPSLV